MGRPAYKKDILVSSASSAAFVELPATDGNLSREGDILDDTDLMTTGTRSRIVGLHDWNVSVTSNYDPTNTGFTKVETAYLNRNPIYVKYLPAGSSLSSLGYVGAAVVETFSFSGGVSDLETVDISLQADGALSNST